MQSYQAEATIQAAPEAVWSVLTDARYPDWDSGVVRVEGAIALDAKIKVVSAVNPGRAFPVRVADLAANERMTWRGGMPLAVHGVRTFTLTPQGDGVTKFELREEFSGPLLPLIWRSMPTSGPRSSSSRPGSRARPNPRAEPERSPARFR